MKLSLTKFRNKISKNLNVSLGFNDPKIWVNTGNFALNYRISSDFQRGIPLGKVTIIAGQPGSGKSYLAAGSIVKQAQAMGIFVLLIDTENALDEAWLQALGVDTGKERMERVSATLVDDVAGIITDFMTEYVEAYKDVPREDRDKVLIVIDSLSMLMTPTEQDQFQKGDMKGDMGRLPRQLKMLVKNCVNMFAQHDIGLVCTNHTYASQDNFDPDDKISGGQGIVYAASIVISMQRRKLKEDEDGKKTTEVNGIRSAIKVMKCRYAKPFESGEIKIWWQGGLDPYSGLIELFEHRGLLVKDGQKLRYVDLAGVEHKYFRNQLPTTLLDIMMAEFRDDCPSGGIGMETDEADEQ